MAQLPADKEALVFSYPFRFPYPHQHGAVSQLGGVPRSERPRPSHFHISHAGAAVRTRAGAAAAGVLVAAALLFGLASSAGAALVSTGACNEAPFSEPFAKWGDTSSYELVAQGSFEGSLSQWALGGGTARVSGSEPYDVTGSAGSYSLELPTGGWAQSPYTCLNASYPTFRFFVRGGGLLPTLSVTVIYKTSLGTVALPLGVAAPGGSWQPTAPMLTGSVVTGLLSGGTPQAALRFTALTGSSQIDDIYIDPRMR